MARSLNVNIIRVLFWICVLRDVCTQWAIDDDGCRTPGGGTGSCIPARQCNTMVKFLRSTPKPISQDVKDKLNLYLCGAQGKTVKVCCPSTPIVIESARNFFDPYTNSDTPPDVSQHKNLKALPRDCGYLPVENKIRSGSDALLNEFPWMAILSYKTNQGPQFLCGGSIVNEKWILTAAHCVYHPKYPLLSIRTGEHNIQTTTDCEMQDSGQVKCTTPTQDLAIEKIKVYPQFNMSNINNDLALIKVTRMNLTVENVRPICLPTDNNTRDEEFNFGVVTGWGATERGPSSDILQKVNVPIFTTKTCKSAYKNQPRVQITHKQICAGGKDTRDSCRGDSGGPLQVARYLDGEVRYVQMGIVSFGTAECGSGEYPGVYTSLAYYMDWILDTIG